MGYPRFYDQYISSVDGLQSAGAITFYSNLFAAAVQLPGLLATFIPSLIVTFSASAMNNWSMTMLGMFSIQQANLISQTANTALIFSNIIGNNLGPHFFPAWILSNFDVDGSNEA